ncbi:hypothetical protein GP486_007604 [Trichoglossum hirsutum]|uniref:Major facilitator superfamily (MFS) profile domain-containing protein n=1 Tax=Trichoglossum hirsutum TaxID=265104 RepID=A0A9P8II03_9PEZI|nr:hypothetical protein GP486_007604 [Trichoglossum hirsutum]
MGEAGGTVGSGGRAWRGDDGDESDDGTIALSSLSSIGRSTEADKVPLLQVAISPANTRSDNVSPNTPPKSEPVTWLSLPHKPQLLILAFCRLSEPLSNTCLLSYLYFLIRSLQPPTSTDAQISRQAGLLVSLFAIAQFLTSMLWGRLADTWGRKPVIVVGLCLSIMSNLGFGFGRSIGAVMAWRLVAGVGNGNIGVMRTMTAEIVREKKYQSRAFLLLPLVFNSGVIAGLAFGGWLADPVTNLPAVFGPEGCLNLAHDPEGVAWMRKFPFALPTMFNAWVLGMSLLLAVCGLKETLPGKAEQRDYGIVVGRTVLRLVKRAWVRGGVAKGYIMVGADGDDDEGDISEKGLYHDRSPGPPPAKRAPPPPFWSIWNRDILYTLLSFALLPLHNSAFMQIFPVFLSTPRAPDNHPAFIFFNGGLGLPSSTVGTWLAVFGASGIFLQLLIYPRMQARIGTLWSYRIALAIFPAVYIFAPYLSLFPDHGIFRWFAISLVLFLHVMSRTFAIPSSVILLTNIAPSPSTLGTIHGAGNMLASLSRAIGPAAGGWVFGWGMDKGVVGVVWWTYLAMIAGLAAVWSWQLKEGKGAFGSGEENGRGGVSRTESREMVSVEESNEKGGGAVVDGEELEKMRELRRPRKNS